jgi:hypothetical protein
MSPMAMAISRVGRSVSICARTCARTVCACAGALVARSHLCVREARVRRRVVDFAPRASNLGLKLRTCGLTGAVQKQPTRVHGAENCRACLFCFGHLAGSVHGARRARWQGRTVGKQPCRALDARVGCGCCPACVTSISTCAACALSLTRTCVKLSAACVADGAAKTLRNIRGAARRTCVRQLGVSFHERGGAHVLFLKKHTISAAGTGLTRRRARTGAEAPSIAGPASVCAGRCRCRAVATLCVDRVLDAAAARDRATIARTDAGSAVICVG